MNKKNLKKIVEYLNESMDNNLLDKKDTEEQIINKVEEYYIKSKFTYKELKLKLIKLENDLLNIDTYSNLSSYGLYMSIFLCLLSNYVALLAKNASREGVISFMLLIVPEFFVILVGIVGRSEISRHFKNKNIKIAINIHKSVVEESLEEMNKKDNINENLKEIKKVLEGTQRETETLGRLFGNQ